MNYERMPVTLFLHIFLYSNCKTLASSGGPFKISPRAACGPRATCWTALAYGISGNLYYCIASFLTNRFQRVKVGSALSENRPVVSGVPQGSVVAAILFNLFINDLTDELESHIISKLFADDGTVYTNISHPDSHLHFQSALDTTFTDILSWMNLNKLLLNPSKTEFLLIGTKTTTSQIF